MAAPSSSASQKQLEPENETSISQSQNTKDMSAPNTSNPITSKMSAFLTTKV